MNEVMFSLDFTSVVMLEEYLLDAAIYWSDRLMKESDPSMKYAMELRRSQILAMLRVIKDQKLNQML